MQKLKCINVKPLSGNDVAPPLELGKVYELKQIYKDRLNYPHYDVGLVSKYNYVTSYETADTLPDSAIGGIHWCHPSRFELIG